MHETDSDSQFFTCVVKIECLQVSFLIKSIKTIKVAFYINVSNFSSSSTFIFRQSPKA